MIVLDASVLIAYLDGEDRQHAAAETLLAHVIDDELAANPLTLAEVLVVPTRTNRLDAVMTALRDLEVQELPFPADSAVRLAGLRVSTRLKMPDCYVLLAAEAAGAHVATFDDRLAKAAEARGVQVRSR